MQRPKENRSLIASNRVGGNVFVGLNRSRGVKRLTDQERKTNRPCEEEVHDTARLIGVTRRPQTLYNQGGDVRGFSGCGDVLGIAFVRPRNMNCCAKLRQIRAGSAKCWFGVRCDRH